MTVLDFIGFSQVYLINWANYKLSPYAGGQMREEERSECRWLAKGRTCGGWLKNGRIKIQGEDRGFWG